MNINDFREFFCFYVLYRFEDEFIDLTNSEIGAVELA